ncbi:hypothetical protein [Clostridium sp. AF32-12BH]|uniref:hypothetical protein n=1 Tax=Clostridium sp. AF32-12BH TaxID=2292006 RepID=UPI000E4697D8|nr:hypothetical protein [Clostridium sp. AF32-12BH]RHP47038.1 hypothetical protein DWZ40_09045 [Clostridium sp. AF32-12BH]
MGSNPTLRNYHFVTAENKTKDVNIILQITKNEAFAMRKILGEHLIKKSYSSNPHYYLVEDGHAVKALEDFRKNNIVATTK